MNNQLKLAAVAAAILLLTACGGTTDAPATISSSSSVAPEASDVASSQSSSSTAPESSSAPTTPAVVTTQTKQVQGFASDAVSSGELYLNGIVLKLGCTIAELQAQLETTDKMRLHSDKGQAKFVEKMQEDKSGGAYGKDVLYTDCTEATSDNVGVQYGWSGRDIDRKYADTIFYEVEAHYSTNEKVAEWGKVAPEEVIQIDVVLPNGWYLGGAVSEEDRQSITVEPPDVSVSQEYTWYTYSVSDAGACGISLKFNIQTGVLSGIRLTLLRD